MGKYFMLAVLWLSTTGGAIALKVFESSELHSYQVWLTFVSVWTFIAALVVVVVDTLEGH